MTGVIEAQMADGERTGLITRGDHPRESDLRARATFAEGQEDAS